MNRYCYLFFVSSLFFLPKLQADHTDERGVVRIDYPIEFCNPCHAANIITEVGESYWRLNNTYGFWWGNCHRAKFSGEFLSAKNCYPLEERTPRRWINQIAFGADYQMMLSHSRFLSLDLGASYAHAYGRKISQPNGGLDSRVSSSNLYDVTLGTTLYFFHDGLLYVYGAWEHLTYKKKYNSDRHIDGLGGGFELTQPLFRSFDVVLKGDFRRAYHFYEGQINWNRFFFSSLGSVGFFGSYVEGKHKLKNEARYGIEFGIDFGSKQFKEYNSSPKAKEIFCSLNAWISTPAVYTPKVFAIADENHCTPPAPTVSVGPLVTTLPFQAGQYFTGTDLEFSMEVTDLTNITINSITGEVSSTGMTAGYGFFVVTATNDCGTAEVFFPSSFGVND